MSTLAITVVDAFTDKPFGGNPAGVCLLDVPLDEAFMQQIAAEMNLSETAFAVKRRDGAYELRWFTPECEVDLCGHATLATAHAMYEQGHARADERLQFHTKSGVLNASLEAGRVVLDFPAQAGKHVAIDTVAECLGVNVIAAAFNDINLLAEVESLPHLLNCQPNMAAIAALDAQGLIVTTASECGAFDFASRYFAPQVGVPEDPVCGSAHCMLAPYWAKKLGKTSFHALQASKRRGELFITLKEERVMLAGYAVTTLRGELPLEERYVTNHAA